VESGDLKISLLLTETENRFVNPNVMWSDYHQNLLVFSAAHVPSVHRISWK